jgi:hypothetical protein
MMKSTNMLRMSDNPLAIAAIVTSNYLPQAMALYSYISESNPDASYIVMLVGESDELSEDLPNGPEWIWWERVIPDSERRIELASEYTPFELSCVVRGRLHHYFATMREFEKWIVMDTDTGILSDLGPVWDTLEDSSIALIAHSKVPVGIDDVIPHETNFLKCGLYNAGVVGMRRSETAILIADWLIVRLEKYGHAYAHRVGLDLPSCNDFEFVDQIWLNLVPLYFRSATVVIDSAICNLGHWNLHEGTLHLKDEQAYFNHEKVVIAHFSGLPSYRVETVSSYSKLYIEKTSLVWAKLAEDYKKRLADAIISVPSLPYSYAKIQPQRSEDSKPLQGAAELNQWSGSLVINMTRGGPLNWGKRKLQTLGRLIKKYVGI